jgi:hypothetical protein
MEVDTILTNIKNDYPDVINAHRIEGMNKQPTTFVRLDIKSVAAIDE